MAVQFPKHECGPYRGRYVDPIGRLEGTFEQLMEAGCIQAENREMEPIFYALMVATKKNPCDGCPVWGDKGPACVAFQQYHSAYYCAEERQRQVIREATVPNNVPRGHQFFGMSVKQIAEQLGVSIGEVRRRKANGTL